MNCRAAAAALIFFAVLGAPRANATVYNLVGQGLGTFTATGTITTDGKIGTLTASDITGLDITVAEGGMFPGTLTHSDLVVSGNELSASATALTFNFDGTGGLFGALTGLPGWNYCVADAQLTCTSLHGDPTSGFEALSVATSSTTFSTIAADKEGSLVIANVAVPEPFTVALFGAGLVGAAALCRRKRANRCA